MGSALKDMDIDLQPPDKHGKYIRTDATFTEIYELISHNKSMVCSELAVLLQLIQGKYVKKISAQSSGIGSCPEKPLKARYG